MEIKEMKVDCSVETSGDDIIIKGHISSPDKGIDLNFDIAGDDYDAMLEELMTDLNQELTKQIQETSNEEVEELECTWEERCRKLENIIQELKEENNLLKIDRTILQRRADDAVKRAYQQKHEYDTYRELFKRFLY